MAAKESERVSKPLWLSDLIRERREAILADWSAAIRDLPIARELTRPALLDHLPELLDRIADLADQDDGTGRVRSPEHVPAAHALERLEEGYDLGEVVTEYAVLRECILRHWERDGVRVAAPSELRILNRALDYAISISVARFTSARERTLRALDRIAAVALGANNLEAFLPALLLVLRETTPTVDWATILLRDGDVLTVRAAVGLEEAEARHESLRVGEGFAGMIAQSACAMSSREAVSDPRVQSTTIRAAGTRALLGVPLLHEGTVMGVAEIGSRTAPDFSDEDKLLFSVMAARATAMIEQHRLRALAEQRALDAQRATRGRDEVLAIVSHDLRNPLSAITVAAALLRNEPEVSAPVRRRVEVIERSAARMTRLLEDLLDVSRIEGGGLVLACSAQHVDDLVHEALEAQRTLAEERSIRLERELNTTREVVFVDRERVLRVFANLLGNALKFTPPGGTITVRAEDDGDGLRFAVADTGAGIAREHLPRIFDRFWQSRHRAQEGAGLGLSIVKGIVEAHGGRVWAESEGGAGSTFYFTLPRAPVEAPAG